MKSKILIVFILFIISFCGLLKIKASDKYYLVKENYEGIYYVQNGLPEHYGSDIQFHFTLNGITAFCTDPRSSIKKYEYFGIPLTETNYDSKKQDYLNKIVYYGYDYPGHQTARYYMATQALIWENVSSYLIEFYTERYGYGNYIDVSLEKNIILKLIEEHENIPTFTKENYTYNLVENLEYTDDLLNEFEILESTWIDTVIEGNKLKIKNLKNFVGTINIKLKKKFYRNYSAKYYYEDGTQSMITGGKPNDIIVSFSIKINGSKLKINKLDSESNLPIKNSKIKFNIRNMETNEYIYINGEKDLSINSDGYLITDLIPYGKYEITEIDSTQEYKINTNPKIVEINSNTNNENNITEVNIYNDKQKGNIQIIKIDSNSKQKLEGVEFTLFASTDIITKDNIKHYSKDEIVSTKKTDKNGEIKFDNLILGNYYIKETNNLKEYLFNDNIYYFDLLSNKNQKIIIENILKKGKISLKKYGELFNYKTFESTFEPLENTEFILYADEDIKTPDNIIHYKKGEIISNKFTNNLGEIEFDNLILGSYCIKEKATKNEYLIDENEYCFNLYENQNQYIELTNYLKKYKLIINKIDSNSKLLIQNSSIKFNIKNIEKNEYVYINNTKDLEINNDGRLIIDLIPYGTYEIKEISTNLQYELDTIPKIITIDKNQTNNNIININFENILKKGKISLKKYGELFNYKTFESTFEPLENTEFILYADEDIKTPDNIIHYKKGEIISNKFTNNLGEIEFDNLILGSYCIKEKATKNEYLIDENEYCFNLYENQNQYIELTNYLKKEKLKIIKVDYETNEPLNNVKFSIFHNDILIGNYFTDKNGTIEIFDLPISIYNFKEIETNKNYVIDDRLYELNLEIDNTITIKNHKKIVMPNTISYDYSIYISVILIFIGIIVCYEIKNN